jgi:hypothetical protein
MEKLGTLPPRHQCDRCGDSLKGRVKFEVAIYVEAIAHYPKSAGRKKVDKTPSSRVLTLCQGCFLRLRDTVNVREE